MGVSRSSKQAPSSCGKENYEKMKACAGISEIYPLEFTRAGGPPEKGINSCIVCTYVSIYIYKYIRYAHKHTYIYIYIHIYIHIRTHIHTYVRIRSDTIVFQRCLPFQSTRAMVHIIAAAVENPPKDVHPCADHQSNSPMATPLYPR